MARIVSKETGAIAPNKAGKSSKGKGKGLSGPGSREPKQKPEVVAFNESTVDAINKAGPKGHEVAHISPREGRILKTLGGSGKPDPKTKIKSYEIVGDKKGNKLPKGKGRGRVDSTHQVAVLTDPEVEALNTMRWRDKDRGFSSGSGPEIMALAEQNDRPFDFLEYRGEVIPTLNDSGSYGGGESGSGSTGGNIGGGNNGGGGGESSWERAQRLAREEAERERIAQAKRDKEAAEQAERDRIAQEQADRDRAVQDAIKAAEKAERERLERERLQAAKEERERKERERIAAQAERDRLAALEATRVEEERIKAEEERLQKLEDERIAREAQEEADRVVAEAEEAERIEQEAQEQAEQEYQDKLEQDRLDALELQEEINEAEDQFEQQYDESDDFLEGEGEYEGDETDTPYMEEDGSFDQIYDQEFGQDEENLDLEGEEPEQDTGTYYDFNEEAGDEVFGDVAGVTDEDGNPQYWHYDPYDYDSPLDEDEDDAISDTSQDDPSGQPEREVEGDYDTSDDDWLEGEGDYAYEPGDPGYHDYDENTLDDYYEVGDEQGEGDEDDSGFFDGGDYETGDEQGEGDEDDSGAFDYLDDIVADDDDTDTYDGSQDDPSGTLDDFDDSDEGFDGDDNNYDDFDDSDEGWDDDDDDQPDTTGGDDGGTDDPEPQTFDGNLSEEEKAGLLEELDKKYGKYAETDYEKLFHDEFADDLKEDWGASRDSAERSYLMSGDLSEFNTRGNTVNDQLIALEESLEGDQQDRLDTMARNYASGPKKALYDWYYEQRNKIQNLKKDEDGNLIGDPDWDELDLSEWADPSDSYDPEFFQDVEYSKLYEDDPVAEDIGGEYYDPEGTDPTFTALGYEDDDDDPRTGDKQEGGPTQEQYDTSGDDPVPDAFEDEGTGADGMGDFGDETLEGFDFGEEFPEGYEGPDTEGDGLGTDNEGNLVTIPPLEPEPEPEPEPEVDLTIDPVEDLFEDEGDDQMGGDGMDWGMGDTDPSSEDFDWMEDIASGGSGLSDDDMYMEIDSLNAMDGLQPGDEGYIYKDDYYSKSAPEESAPALVPVQNYAPMQGNLAPMNFGSGLETLSTTEAENFKVEDERNKANMEQQNEMDFNFGPDMLAPGETAVPDKSTMYNDTRVSNKKRPLRASERPRRKRNIYNKAA